MIKFRTKASLKGLGYAISKIVDRQLEAEIQEKVIAKIKEFIRAESSPVERFGKFKKLSDKWAARKLKTIGSRKADLELSGEMLDSLDAWVNGNKNIVIGISQAASADVKARAEGNNEGQQRTFFNRKLRAKGNNKKAIKKFKAKQKSSKGLPARPFIPTDGRSFNATIMSLIKQIYADKILRLTKTRK